LKIIRKRTMPKSALTAPAVDPTPIFEHFRGSYGTELLTAAVAHFDVFRRLAERPRTLAELAGELGLAMRPAVVLVTALRAMRLLEVDGAGRLVPTAIAGEYLVAEREYYVGDYVGLAAEAPGVLGMVERLRTNRPYGAPSNDEPAGSKSDDGTAFIYREGTPSAMEHEAAARRLTLALAGRAKNVAPAVAAKLAVGDATTLLDLGGGTGIYSIALVQKNPRLRAIVFDRPEVLKVAAEMAAAYGVTDRVTLAAGDMFVDPLPRDCDLVLLSNILHDWDVPECEALVARSAAALKTGGRVVIHDVFLNDAMDGSLPIALYSAALFTLTEGRAYSAAEYRAMLENAGLQAGQVVPTAIHCGLLEGRKG
jgi:predicted O-methyltransferase YrrM